MTELSLSDDIMMHGVLQNNSLKKNIGLKDLAIPTKLLIFVADFLL